jgi:hypothetical protein
LCDADVPIFISDKHNPEIIEKTPEKIQKNPEIIQLLKTDDSDQTPGENSHPD